VLKVIHQYKYNRAFWFEPLLGEWLACAAAAELKTQDWDALVPVPLHPVKEREREFNQAERLAQQLGSAIGLTVQPKWLRRVRATQSQTRLNREERHQNMHKAFEASPDGCLKGKRVVLIDDVMTTGATTSSCAKALKKAGAASVCVWTVARGI
jgi:ComF family protein